MGHQPVRAARPFRFLSFWGAVVVGAVLAAGFTAGAQELRGLSEVKERACDFPKIEVRREQVGEGVWRATGVSNVYLVQVPGGYVLVDSGLPHQQRV